MGHRAWGVGHRRALRIADCGLRIANCEFRLGVGHRAQGARRKDYNFFNEDKGQAGAVLLFNPY